MHFLRQEIGHFLFGLIALTGFPATTPFDQAVGRLARSARYFPLVGVLIGLASGLVFYGAALIMAPTIAAGLALATGMLVTGALHEDGLADSFDGLAGLPDRERVFEIMRDNRIGRYGVTSLVISIGLRWAALATFNPFEGMLALILAHALSRAMLAPVLTSGHYARSRGLAVAVAGGTKGAEALVALLLALLVSMIAGPALGLVAIAAAVVGAGLTLAVLMRVLGGYTGQSLGAIQQCSEIAVLVTLSAALS